MNKRTWADNYLVWAAIEAAAMGLTAWGLSCLAGIAGNAVVGQSIAPTAILFSVAVAIVIQLWVKLNELSGLAGLNERERRALWEIVQPRVRSLVELVVFFVLLIFMVITAGILGSASHTWAGSILSGVGAGFGASFVLIAGVLVDLNEVADFRWLVELGDLERERTETTLKRLDGDEPGFEDDEHLQGYKRVINDG